MTPPITAHDVLEFWFGSADPAVLLQPRAAWFRKDKAFDAQIRERFGAAIESALAGGLHDWDATAPGRLARIVVLDQFTRNVFRGTARAFAGDALALAAAQAMIDAGLDATLQPVQRSFVYLPFQHAEDLAVQQRSVQLFTALAAAAPALADHVDYAVRHRDIVERFGRFPHRNAQLGRASSAEEIEFLKTPGSSF